MAETLKRLEILRLKRDISRVMKTGRRLSGTALLLRCCRQPETSSTTPSRRMAVLVSRRTASAVGRNLVRRRLREIYRRNRSHFPEGYDYILQAGPGSAALSFADLRSQALHLAGMVAAGD